MTDAANQKLELFFVACWSHLFNDFARIVKAVTDKFEEVGGVSEKVDELDESDKLDKENSG